MEILAFSSGPHVSLDQPCEEARIYSKGTGEPLRTVRREQHNQICSFAKSSLWLCGVTTGAGVGGGESGSWGAIRKLFK